MNRTIAQEHTLEITISTELGTQKELENFLNDILEESLKRRRNEWAAFGERGVGPFVCVSCQPL